MSMLDTPGYLVNRCTYEHALPCTACRRRSPGARITRLQTHGPRSGIKVIHICDECLRALNLATEDGTYTVVERTDNE